MLHHIYPLNTKHTFFLIEYPRVCGCKYCRSKWIVHSTWMIQELNLSRLIDLCEWSALRDQLDLSNQTLEFLLLIWLIIRYFQKILNYKITDNTKTEHMQSMATIFYKLSFKVYKVYNRKRSWWKFVWCYTQEYKRKTFILM